MRELPAYEQSLQSKRAAISLEYADVIKAEQNNRCLSYASDAGVLLSGNAIDMICYNGSGQKHHSYGQDQHSRVGTAPKFSSRNAAWNHNAHGFAKRSFSGANQRHYISIPRKVECIKLTVRGSPSVNRGGDFKATRKSNISKAKS